MDYYRRPLKVQAVQWQGDYGQFLRSADWIDEGQVYHASYGFMVNGTKIDAGDYVVHCQGVMRGMKAADFEAEYFAPDHPLEFYGDRFSRDVSFVPGV